MEEVSGYWDKMRKIVEDCDYFELFFNEHNKDLIENHDLIKYEIHRLNYEIQRLLFRNALGSRLSAKMLLEVRNYLARYLDIKETDLEEVELELEEFEYELSMASSRKGLIGIWTSSPAEVLDSIILALQEMFSSNIGLYKFLSIDEILSAVQCGKLSAIIGINFDREWPLLKTLMDNKSQTLDLCESDLFGHNYSRLIVEHLYSPNLIEIGKTIEEIRKKLLKK